MNLVNTVSALNSWGILVSSELRGQISARGHDATGLTGQSINGVVFNDGSEIGVSITSRSVDGVPVLNPLDTGRRPGRRPTYQAIEKWIRAKKIQPRDEKGRFSAKDRDYKRAAFLIAREIGESGTIAEYNYGGADIIQPTIQMNLPKFDKWVGEALALDLGKELKDQLKNL